MIRDLARSFSASEPCYDARVRRVARRVLPVLYAGRSVGCPCCGGRFRRFVRRYGSDQLCPRCLSLQRHRSFWLFISERLPLAAEHETAILHIAPEEGISERLRSHPALRYVTADANPGSIAELAFDVMDIPFTDCSFDVVLCNHVLEHVEDDRAAMRELFRVLKPSGTFYSQHPVDVELERTVEDRTITDPAERTRLFGQHDHLRRYGSDFLTRLREAGFDVELVRFSPAPEIVTFYGLRDQERIFVCRRPGEPTASP